MYFYKVFDQDCFSCSNSKYIEQAKIFICQVLWSCHTNSSSSGSSSSSNSNQCTGLKVINQCTGLNVCNRYTGLDFISPSKCTAKQITFRQYHRIDRDQMNCDLFNNPFVSSSSDNASGLYAQHISNLSYELDQHATLKTNV
jgi:hypothetical protein